MTQLFGNGGLLLGLPGVATMVTAVLDAAGDKIGARIVCPKDGTIDRLACYCTAVSSPVSTDIRLETISAGAPSGTLFATNTSGSFTPAASTLHVITLTASTTVQAGDLIGVVLNAPTAGAGNTQTFNARNTHSGQHDYSHYPRAMQDLSAGSWSDASSHPTIVPVYSDGTYVNYCIPHASSTNTSFNNTSTPDERGIRWTQVGNSKCVGAILYIRGVAAGCNFNIKLYPTTADNAAPIASYTATASQFFISTSALGPTHFYWDGIDLTDGTDYRLTIQPSTANNVLFQDIALPNADIRKATSHGYLTTRTRTADADDGAWTDTTTNYCSFLTPIFSQSNTVAGGGGYVIGS